MVVVITINMLGAGVVTSCECHHIPSSNISHQAFTVNLLLQHLTTPHHLKLSGEAEFIFASIKVITIVGLIILGIVLDLGGGPDHDRYFPLSLAMIHVVIIQQDWVPLLEKPRSVCTISQHPWKHRYVSFLQHFPLTYHSPYR